MSYNGFEIDMLNVGDADCILVTEWAQNKPTRVLIDGGNAESAKVLKSFLQTRGISYIDHVVSSHPHDDHARGLIELANDTSVEIGVAWIHRPELHVDMLQVEYALNQVRGIRRTQAIQESLQTTRDLITQLERRNIPVFEPFVGQEIGCLTVAGPSEKYYAELLAQFADESGIEASERVRQGCEIQELVEAFMENMSTDSSGELLDNPQTQPENNSSVILATAFDGNKYLFTADAGAQALSLAANAYDLADCWWMQIPHHGSRRNITEDIIELFCPKIAYVSAAGNRKHPRRAVVNAFKKNGASVYSTHYPIPNNIWHHYGDVPDRADYSVTIPLWEAST